MRFKFYALKLTVVCVIVFIIQFFFPNSADMFLVSQKAPLELWRFVTAVFLHASVTHLLYNSFALVLFGSIFERLTSSNKFLFTFFIAGIGANAIALFFYPASLGASGAIYGIIGALMLVRPNMMVFAFGLPMPMIVAGLLWAGGDIIGVFNPTTNTGYIAHLAGISIGLVLGALYRDWHAPPQTRTRVNLNEHYMQNWEDHYLR